MQRRIRNTALILLLLLVATCQVGSAGCARPVARTFAVYPVDGELFVDGKPAVGVVVTFVPEAGQPGVMGATATVRSDGHFIPTQPDGAIGLREGRYDLTVQWLSGQGPSGGTASDTRTSIGSCSVKPGVNFIPPIRIGKPRP